MIEWNDDRDLSKPKNPWGNDPHEENWDEDLMKEE